MLVFMSVVVYFDYVLVVNDYFCLLMDIGLEFFFFFKIIKV